KRVRVEESLSGCLLVFVQSSPVDDSAPCYNKSITGAFSEPTDSAVDFVKAAVNMVSNIYKEGIKYKKCGV
ncbi:DNA polymerase V subunit UmuC, partial [Acinetobacter calcoaceticus]